MPQAKTDRQPTSLSLSLSSSRTLSVAQNDLPLWTRVCATGRPLASIYQRWAHPEYCLSFWQEANQTNTRTNGEQEGKSEGRRTKGEKQTYFANLFNQVNRYTLKWSARSRQAKKAGESSLTSRRREGAVTLSMICMHLSVQISLTVFLSEQPLPPWVLLQLWLSFCLQFISHSLALFFLHLDPHSSNWLPLSCAILLHCLPSLLSIC